MNINDVLEQFLKFKSMVNKFYTKPMDIINQDIHFRDLVIRSKPPNCYGESKNHTNQYLQSTEERLNAHISSIFNLANEDHSANFCEKTGNDCFKLKTGMENHITRVTMNEFSLYTSKPLTMAEFANLDNNIRNMATKLEPNVHVLLSSFAVKDQHGKILNMSMYVEGGEPPRIHSFCKNTASGVDIDYGNQSQLFSQQKAATRPTHHADTLTSESGENIFTGSVFEVTTAGGARYTQTIDVCLDHALGHSKEQIARRLFEDASPDEIIPLQIEQCVTSNWIDIVGKSIVSDKILHADPVCSMIEKYRQNPENKLLIQMP